MGSTKAEREARFAELAAKVRRPGEFIHIDGPRPRLASGDYVPRGTGLKALEDAGVVVVVQSDLFGRPLQWGTKRRGRVGR